MMKVCGNGEDISSQFSTRGSGETNNKLCRRFVATMLSDLQKRTDAQQLVCPCNLSCAFK